MRVWLCSIAKNLYYTHYQKQKRMDYGINLENWEDEETEDRQFVAQIADRETAFQIHKVLHCLREPYKEIFSLRIFGELSFKEIGQLFHRSEHWACVTYHRAKEMIRREIESKGGNKNEDRL